MRCTALAAVLIFAAACGPPPLQTGPTVPTLVQVGGGQRPVRTLTDLDDVRDVVSAGDYVYVATDLGLLVHPASGATLPERYTTEQGLPSNDVRAVAATEEGAVMIATANGLATLDGGEVTPMTASAPVGEVTALHVDPEGTPWACGSQGVARMGADGWERFGEPAACTTLVPTPEGDLWVGTTRGLWHVEGDVVREHGQGVLPEAHVRDVVPVADGEVMALLQGPSSSQIGYYDGNRWFGYTVEGFDPAAVGLAGIAGHVMLVTPERAYAISPAEVAETGVPLTPLSRSEPRQAVSYRARVTPAAEVQAPEARTEPERVLREPTPLVDVPTGHPTLDAPAFVIGNTDLPIPEHTYLVRREPEALFLAARNLGVTAFGRGGRSTALRSRGLVHEQDLQIASSIRGNPWTLGTNRDVAGWRGDGLHRVERPEGIVPQAIASGPHGVYVAALLEETPRASEAGPVEGEEAPEEDDAEEPDTSAAAPPDALPVSGGPTARTVRIYRVDDEGWTPVAERTLSLSTPLVSTPFLAVSNDEEFWLGLRVEHESGAGTRMRGVAVFGTEGNGVTFHHRSADRQRDGEEALRMPDEVTGVDLGHAGYAWLPSLSGAIRVGDHQAVVFGEARGVRGEVVTDLAVGDNERIWLAAAEGVGYRESGSFEFGQIPARVQEARPTALALDSRGHIWGAGRHGVVFFDGSAWQILDEQTGLPTTELVDVEVDASDRVWLLASDRVILFAAPQQAPPGGFAPAE